MMEQSGGVDFARIAEDAGVDQTIVWQMLVSGMSGLAPGDIARIQAALDRAGISTRAVQEYRKDIPGSVLVILSIQQHQDEYSETVFKAFQYAAVRRRIEVMRFEEMNTPLSDLVSLFRAFDAAVMIATRQTQFLVDNCAEAGCPYVLVEVDSANLTGLGSRLTVDNTAGTEAIMRHLLELGHRRIGHVTGDWGHSSAQERLAVYRRALAEAGIPPADELVVRGRWNEEAGYTGARTLLGLADRPTAIFAASDMIAFGVIRAALENGLRVPDDLSVVGFDDIAIAGAFSPPLTTVRQEEETLGRMACEHVAAWLQGTPPAPRETVFPVQLIVRQSTGPAPRR